LIEETLKKYNFFEGKEFEVFNIQDYGRKSKFKIKMKGKCYTLILSEERIKPYIKKLAILGDNFKKIIGLKYLSEDNKVLILDYFGNGNGIDLVKIDSTLENNDYQFKANGSILVFDGYLKVYSDYEKNEDVILPDFNKYENIIESEEIVKEQHFTKPPARYTEASLIDEMESLGIGRPSTYAPTMETLKKRAYVTIDNKKFIPTEVGIETTDKLQEFFSNIINVEYTANMEHDLDEIALDKCDNIVVLKDFYNIFEPIVEDAFKNMEKKEAKETGESCPECDSPLVIRRGKYGEFIACSNYPECKFIKKKEVEVKEIMSCPKCQEGTVIEKNTRRGKTFWGCNRFPTCDFASWYEPVEEKCPECSGVLVKKKDKLVCINCEYEKEESN